MPTIREFREEDLPQLTLLINLHITMLIPAWGLPSAFIRSHLDLNPEQNIIDPWVIERKTLLAFSGEKLVAAGHLLRYGTGEDVSESYHNTGDIAWFVFFPEFKEDAKALLDACLAAMREWGVLRIGAWDSGLPIPCTVGIYDKWPHLAQLFREAGFRPKPEREEAVWGGAIKRYRGGYAYALGGFSIIEREERFIARMHGEQIGYCLVKSDLTHQGAVPALKDWAELYEIEVNADWRRSKIGTWLLLNAMSMLARKDCKYIVFAVAIEDERAGAGEFYRSMGWNLISRCEDGWELLVPANE